MTVLPLEFTSENYLYFGAPKNFITVSALGKEKMQLCKPDPIIESEIFLDFRSNLTDINVMTGKKFIRKVKKVGRNNGIIVEFTFRRGKGSHGTLFYGSRFTIVRNPKDELKTGTLHAMLSQLGLTFEDI